MPEVFGVDRILSFIARGRFGIFPKYGTAQFGYSRFGDDDVFLFFTEYGNATFGVDPFSDVLLLSGIYRRAFLNGRVRDFKQPYYITRNPRTVKQQAHRERYGQAVGRWRNLSSEEKTFWNKKAFGRRFSGWNLFYKEYLKNHP